MTSFVRFKPEYAEYWQTDVYAAYRFIRYSLTCQSVWIRRGPLNVCVPVQCVEIW